MQRHKIHNDIIGKQGESYAYNKYKKELFHLHFNSYS